MVAERTSGQGVVLASYGRGVLVQAGSATLRCGLVGRKLRLVCGDRVNWRRAAAADEASVDTAEARRNVIERIDARGRPEPVAANIDRLAIVVAPEPSPDWFLVDRYWAGACNKDIGAVLLINKQDFGTAPLQAELDTYRGLGLPCLEISAVSTAGMEALGSALQSGVTLLVGQSGVGKSSIVNALAPEAAAQTAELTRDHGPLVPPGRRCGDHRRTGGPRFCPASIHRARRGTRLRRNPLDRCKLPFRRLPSLRGTGLRGARRRRGTADIAAPLRELSAADAPLRGFGQAIDRVNTAHAEYSDRLLATKPRCAP